MSECGRSITGDNYIAMNYGPVPSYIEDIFKAVRHQSYFSQYAKEFEGVLTGRAAKPSDVFDIPKTTLFELS